jgi:hypothetical protein
MPLIFSPLDTAEPHWLLIFADIAFQPLRHSHAIDIILMP